MARSRSRSRSVTRSRSPAKRRDRSGSPAEAENGCPFLIRLFVTKGKHTSMIDFDEGRLPMQDEFLAYGWKHSTPSSLIQLLLPSFPPPYRSPLARYSFRHIYVDASPRGLYRNKDLVSFTGRDLMNAALPVSSASTSAKASGADADADGSRMDMDVELDDMPVRGTDRHGAGGSGTNGTTRGEAGARKIDEKTLEGYGFVTGDLLSVSLHIPEPRGLRRPTGPGQSGPGFGPGVGAGPGGPADRGSFGWSNGGVGGGGGGPGLGAGGGGGGGGGGAGAGEAAGQADRTGPWERGAPLPPQNSARAAGGRPSFGAPGGPGGFEGRDGAPAGGRWGRGGAVGMGIRGQAGDGAGPGPRRRSRSPDYNAGGRDDARGERHGDRGRGERRSRSRSRSKSPERRRESWAARR